MLLAVDDELSVGKRELSLAVLGEQSGPHRGQRLRILTGERFGLWRVAGRDAVGAGRQHAQLGREQAVFVLLRSLSPFVAGFAESLIDGWTQSHPGRG